MRGKAPLLNAMATLVKAVSNISNDRFMAGTAVLKECAAKKGE